MTRLFVVRILPILIGTLACVSVSGQETLALSTNDSPGAAPEVDARSGGGFRIMGVLISRFERTALINGKVVREGDRVGGVEILDISQDGVRLNVGVQTLRVGVGGTFDAANVADNDYRHAQRHARPGSNPAGVTAPPTESGAPDVSAQQRHMVMPGETLSGIALQYLGHGVTIDQMMIALFHANSQAFDNNINLMYHGASLRIPNQRALDRHAPKSATAEVARFRKLWETGDRRNVKVASVDTRIDESPDGRQYGPVEHGETLSAIALHELRAQNLTGTATLDQMMIAMLRANPDAFENNINVLRQGAVLRVPDRNALRRFAPDKAAAEVVRQTVAWQSGRQRPADPETATLDVMASVN